MVNTFDIWSGPVSREDLHTMLDNLASSKMPVKLLKDGEIDKARAEGRRVFVFTDTLEAPNPAPAPERFIKVLWPDGPRMVSEHTIKSAAMDVLTNEDGFDLLPGVDPEEDYWGNPSVEYAAAYDKAWNEMAEDMTLSEAVEIVNHHGCYTTAAYDGSDVQT